MLLSADIFDRTHDSRNSWEELSVSPLGDFGLKRAFPSSLTKLIGSELDTAPSFSFDANRLPAAAIPSLSLESLALGVFLEEEDESEFSLPYHHDDTVLEFDGKGQLLSKDSNLPVLPQQSEYYGDLFLSWEDDPFAVLPVVTEKPTEEVTSPNIPLSPTFSSTVDSSSDSSDSSDSDSSSSSDSESDCAVQRRRNAKRNRGDAPRPTQRRIPPSLEKANKPRTPSKPKSPPAKPKKAPVVNPETPIKRRRRSVSRRKSPNTPDLSVEIVAEISTSSHDEESSLLLRTCPTPKKGKIGLLSTSTHELSAEAIRNIFKAEQVVTLSKTEDEDDEEVDIL